MKFICGGSVTVGLIGVVLFGTALPREDTVMGILGLALAASGLGIIWISYLFSQSVHKKAEELADIFRT